MTGTHLALQLVLIDIAGSNAKLGALYNENDHRCNNADNDRDRQVEYNGGNHRQHIL